MGSEIRSRKRRQAVDQLPQAARVVGDQTLQVASVVVFPLSLVIGLWHAARVWSGNRRWPAKLWSIVLVVAFATVLWVALAFHLIGFGTNY